MSHKDTSYQSEKAQHEDAQDKSIRENKQRLDSLSEVNLDALTERVEVLEAQVTLIPTPHNYASFEELTVRVEELEKHTHPGENPTSPSFEAFEALAARVGVIEKSEQAELNDNLAVRVTVLERNPSNIPDLELRLKAIEDEAVTSDASHEALHTISDKAFAAVNKRIDELVVSAGPKVDPIFVPTPPTPAPVVDEVELAGLEFLRAEAAKVEKAKAQPFNAEVFNAESARIEAEKRADKF